MNTHVSKNYKQKLITKSQKSFTKQASFHANSVHCKTRIHIISLSLYYMYSSSEARGFQTDFGLHNENHHINKSRYRYVGM